MEFENTQVAGTMSDDVKDCQQVGDTAQSAAASTTSAPQRISPTLDWRCEQFDPLRALYANDYRVTEKLPKVHYQNLAAFETAFKRSGILNMGKRSKAGDASTTKGTAKTAPQDDLNADDIIARRFQPHQIAIRTGGDDAPHIRRRHKRNLYAKMANASGPMAVLSLAVQQQRRVLIKTRNGHGMRGTLEGVVTLFDKHWNLLLRDVVEVWQRRKHKYSEHKIIGEPQDCSAILSAMGIRLPKTQVRSVNRKTVEIRRQLKQLFVRGEHVAVIVFQQQEQQATNPAAVESVQAEAQTKP